MRFPSRLRKKIFFNEAWQKHCPDRPSDIVWGRLRFNPTREPGRSGLVFPPRGAIPRYSEAGVMGLLSVECYPKTEDFMTAVNAQFARGAQVVQVAQDHRIIGTMFSPGASKEML